TGVGQLLAEAAAAGARRVVVGLGGSGTNDGGAGALAELGAVADVPLDRGGLGLAGVTHVDLAEARARVQGLALVAATDVDSPLTGLFGATKTFGPQKGIDENTQLALDGYLEAFAAITDRRLALKPGAGAAGGLGFALMLLGGERISGVELVAEAVGVLKHAASADLVITGEGAFDFSSRVGKVPAGVAALAAQALRPCIALAGQVLVGSREMRALGMDSAYSLVEAVGEQRAFADPAGALSEVTARVARTWSR
ncbi:MAG: glycerate kinase, partial [Nocardioidaceae bacterium]|nr:glycerate kinase [Nocardioidaceae bacterium]